MMNFSLEEFFIGRIFINRKNKFTLFKTLFKIKDQIKDQIKFIIDNEEYFCTNFTYQYISDDFIVLECVTLIKV